MSTAAYIDFALVLFTYTILIGFILRRRKGNKPADDPGDDGGILAWTEPDLDLPPGVSLPTGPDVRERRLTEELA